MIMLSVILNGSHYQKSQLATLTLLLNIETLQPKPNTNKYLNMLLAILDGNHFCQDSPVQDGDL